MSPVVKGSAGPKKRATEKELMISTCYGMYGEVERNVTGIKGEKSRKKAKGKPKASLKIAV